MEAYGITPSQDAKYMVLIDPYKLKTIQSDRSFPAGVVTTFI